MTTKELRVSRVLTALRAYVKRTGDVDLHGGEELQTAQDWAKYCSLKPSEMPKWWAVGCFEPEAAQELIDGGMDLGLARRTCKDTYGKIETFAYHVSNGMPILRMIPELIFSKT